MRTTRTAASAAVVTALALSVSACSGTPAMTTSTTAPTTRPAPTTVAMPDASKDPVVADRMVTGDLLNMARVQDEYIKTHRRKRGIAVTASKAGKPLSVTHPNDFPTLPGDVVSVTISTDGYCVAVYNKYATKAKTAAESALYKSAANPPLQKALGHC